MTTAHTVMTASGYHMPRPFSEFRTEGILWLLNTSVMHPRGFALVFHYDGTDPEPQTEPTGWSIIGDGTEPWVMQDGPDNNARFEAFEALLDSLRAEP